MKFPNDKEALLKKIFEDADLEFDRISGDEKAIREYLQENGLNADEIFEKAYSEISCLIKAGERKPESVINKSKKGKILQNDFTFYLAVILILLAVVGHSFSYFPNLENYSTITSIFAGLGLFLILVYDEIRKLRSKDKKENQKGEK